VLVAALAALVWLGWLARASLMAARMYQIEEYEAKRLLAWGRQPAWLASRAALSGGAAALVIGLAVLIAPGVRPLSAGLGWLGGALLLHALWQPLAAKKPLVYTARLRRILGGAGGVALVLAGVLVWAVPRLPSVAGVVLAALLCLVAPGLTLLLVIAGNGVMLPVERRIQADFIARAHARVLEYKPLVIGIAGSYGKTSTKHILAGLLNVYTDTLPTPKSYNTLMGITRTINEYLQPRHRAFVVEMDPYAPGEVAAMCRLADPTVALITSVGPQHLERFGTQERIGDAIYELVAALPPGSAAVIYGGEPQSARLAERAAREGYRVVRYGLAAEEDVGPLDVTAGDVTLDGRGAQFTWRWPAAGLEQRVSIPLLGRHNILNVSAALAVMHLLGYPVGEAARDARRLEPVEHRLQLLRGPGGITIIDDSYNANPVGIHNGLDVLAAMSGSPKILVTPGLVELGVVQDAENARVGEHAARVCDQVILVGAAQTKPIAAGLRAAGGDGARVHVVETLDEVQALIARLAGPGAVVLFANDLPDTYLAMR
jgi:UDP-N-acetylmuramoyl-tripeptide--D-alanyl-D-alanine ligase